MLHFLISLRTHLITFVIFRYSNLFMNSVDCIGEKQSGRARRAILYWRSHAKFSLYIVIPWVMALQTAFAYPVSYNTEWRPNFPECIFVKRNSFVFFHFCRFACLFHCRWLCRSHYFNGIFRWLRTIMPGHEIRFEIAF